MLESDDESEPHTPIVSNSTRAAGGESPLVSPTAFGPNFIPRALLIRPSRWATRASASTPGPTTATGTGICCTTDDMDEEESSSSKRIQEALNGNEGYDEADGKLKAFNQRCDSYSVIRRPQTFVHAVESFLKTGSVAANWWHGYRHEERQRQQRRKEVYWRWIAAAPWTRWRRAQSCKPWTTPLGAGWADNGVVIVDMYGGMGGGLHAALYAGLHVRKYVHIDKDEAAQKFIDADTRELQWKWVQQLGAAAFYDIFSAGHEVEAVARGELGWLDQVQTEHPNTTLMVFAGWPCQDLSDAGTQRGLEGENSGTQYRAMMQAMDQIKERWRSPMAYVVENVAFQYAVARQEARQREFREVCSQLGRPVVVDAALLGSAARRVRNVWTNTCEPGLLQAALDHAGRPPWSRTFKECLLDGSTPQKSRSMRHPNRMNEVMVAAPTVMATPGSYSFSHGGPGMVLGTNGALREPTIEEKERLMGYLGGVTSKEIATGVWLNERQRLRLIGNAWDAIAMEAVLACAKLINECAPGEAMVSEVPESMAHFAEVPKTDIPRQEVMTAMACAEVSRANWWQHQGFVKVQPHADAGAETEMERVHDQAAMEDLWAYYRHPKDRKGVGSNVTRSGKPRARDGHSSAMCVCLASMEAQAARKDIWEDTECLEFLNGKPPLEGQSREQGTRIRRRAASYAFEERAGKRVLMKTLPNGSKRVIPAPSERRELIKEAHEKCGHFGVRRTLHLVAQQDTGLQLQPLPIKGLFYRWHVDLAGPMEETTSGNRYFAVMIEAFSKALVVVPLPDKEASTVAMAFALHVLARHGSCAEVVTDNGSEFKGAFDTLLEKALIDHRHTSREHPQADGLAERAVQTVKEALKRCLEHDANIEWDERVPWVVMGYMASAQSSTGFKPYELLHGHPITVPPSIRERMEEDLDVEGVTETDEDYDRLAHQLLRRAELMQRHMVVAGNNLKIAQHRDTMRFADVRSGKYRRKQLKYEPGDFVYVSQLARSALQPHVQRTILRVVRAGTANGTYILQGADGKEVMENEVHMAPCHLPIAIGVPTDEGVKSCKRCKGSENLTQMLECEACGAWWHLACLPPGDHSQRENRWLCHECKAKGVQWTDKRVGEETDTGYHPPATPAAQAREARLRELDGTEVARMYPNPRNGRMQRYTGTARFELERFPPYRFVVSYRDGDTELMTESEVRKYATDTERKIAQHAHAMGVMQRAGHLAKHRESTEDLQLLMAWLMPGITKYQVGRIGSALEDVHNKTAELEVVVTPEADVQSLVDLIRSACRHHVDIHAALLIRNQSGVDG
ncbi:reverse transcriptase [Pseudoscourfieldia marina]